MKFLQVYSESSRKSLDFSAWGWFTIVRFPLTLLLVRSAHLLLRGHTFFQAGTEQCGKGLVESRLERAHECLY